MKVLGIISEYNPFHNGHAWQLRAARSGCDFVVAAMSGNFVQRGEPALVDKYLRTRMALADGVDMVLELPLYCATASAEAFAYNAVRLLNATGVIDELAFGSESGSLATLRQCAQAFAVEDAPYKAALHAELKRGAAYPRARADAARAICTGPEVPTAPNDILAVEYLKALKRTGSRIVPIAVTRREADHHDQSLTGAISSATAIRHAFLRGELDEVACAMPAPAFAILRDAYAEGGYVPGADAYSKIFRYLLRTRPLDGIMDISEGLQNRFIEMSGTADTLSAIVSAVKTKRYTRTRLNRAALHILLDMSQAAAEDFNEQPLPYIRVLGMKKTAGALMNALTAHAEATVVTTLRPTRQTLDARGRELLAKEITATDIYYLGLTNRVPVAAAAEYRKEFILV